MVSELPSSVARFSQSLLLVGIIVASVLLEHGIEFVNEYVEHVEMFEKM